MFPDRLSMYLKSRRSVRHFTSQMVEKEKILQMLDITRYAASGCNSQPVACTVIYGGQEVHKLAGLTLDWIRHLYESRDPLGMALHPLITAWERGVDAICWNAPHLLVAHIPENHISAPTDGIIALTHFDRCTIVWSGGPAGQGFWRRLPARGNLCRVSRAAAVAHDLPCHDVRLSAAQNLSHTEAKSVADLMAIK